MRVTTIIAIALVSATAQSGSSETIPGLGTTSFPTSTHSPRAEAAFLRGLLLLHLFEYSDAAEAFITAEKLDPAFSMAYWGEAMTSNHGVWNQVDVPAGKAALNKLAPTAAARAARTPDPRERAYLASVEILYDGVGVKSDRDRRYAKAMERLSTAYPADPNAQLFYALSLLGESEGVRDVPVYLHAAEISQAVFRRKSANPGAAHYWIHGMDDPDHAADALEAARALSRIAPDAAHAQHMCSHIFMALGMWDDVVQANLAAMRVSNRHDRASGIPPNNCGHYPDWLEYGYFQQGRLRAARQTLVACAQTNTELTLWAAAHPGLPVYGGADVSRVHRRLVNSYAAMRGMSIIESQDWNMASGAVSDISALSPEEGGWSEFVTGFAGAERGDLADADSALQRMRTKTEAFRSGNDPDPEDLKALAVAAGELSGLAKVKAGRYQAGADEVRESASAYRAMAFAFGPPVTFKPPEELLGEILLAKGDGAAARQSFEQALRRAPGRTESLLGLARAEQLAGNETSARKAYQKLAAIWHAADADTPGLTEARAASTRMK